MRRSTALLKVSIPLLLTLLLELTVNEVFLVKALKFQLVVYTPFHILDFMVDKLSPAYGVLDAALLRKTLSDLMVKLY